MTRYLLVFFTLITFSVQAQLQSPAQFLGYEIGTEFSRHADVVRYFEHVAANSDMVQFSSYGKTYERRPLTYAVVSSAENLRNIENIRQNNLKQTGILEGSATPEIAIVWLSYNVHGNEASSTEASMVTLYKLITEKQSWLQNTVVIIDPCINPDGRDRYANWYNQVKSQPYNSAQIAAEHHEPWPGGRPNHYLFDLNRDWAWATQIESQERLKIYNQWMPHVHVDFHEQGINEPYYFAPAAAPYHEVISKWQRDFQVDIGKNHAKYFDKEGWLFFTRERFDLLYPSYGDTYPTFMGAIGMTYEQAGHGRAGLGIQTDEGYELTLVDRVAHHVTTGLSTVEISAKNAAKLNTEFKKYFQNDGLRYKSYVLSGEKDKINAVAKLLDKHQIKYGFTNARVTGYQFSTATNATVNTENALVVSTNQPKGKMVKVLFEQEAKLEEPLTYDITAWSIPYAYGLDCIASTTLVNTNASNPSVKEINQVLLDAAGYIAKWNSLEDTNFLVALLEQNIKVRFSEKDLSFNGEQFKKGSLVITKSDNRSNKSFAETVTKIANQYQRKLYASSTSFSDNKTDFGSPDIKLINKERVAILKGDGVSSLSFGSIWHFFEQQLHYPLTAIDTDYFSASALKQFDVLILPNGWYGSTLNKDTLSSLKEWVRAGGKVIAIASALRAFEGEDGFGLSKNKTDEDEEDNDNEDKLIPYDQRERNSLKDFITGSIFKITVDDSHPMAFGFGKTYYSLKLGSDSYQFLESGYNVGYIKDEAMSVSGFSGADAKAKLTNSLVFGEVSMGRGSMIYMVDDPLFRSFWENGKMWLVNSIFMVNANVVHL